MKSLLKLKPAISLLTLLVIGIFLFRYQTDSEIQSHKSPSYNSQESSTKHTTITPTPEEEPDDDFTRLSRELVAAPNSEQAHLQLIAFTLRQGQLEIAERTLDKYKKLTSESPIPPMLDETLISLKKISTQDPDYSSLADKLLEPVFDEWARYSTNLSGGTLAKDATIASPEAMMLRQQEQIKHNKAELARAFPNVCDGKSATEDILAEVQAQAALISAQAEGKDLDKTLYDELVSKFPSSVTIHQAYIEKLIMTQKFEEALGVTTKLHEQFPSEPSYKILTDGLQDVMQETTLEKQQVKVANLTFRLASLAALVQRCAGVPS